MSSLPNARYSLSLECNARDNEPAWVVRYDGAHIGWEWSREDAIAIASRHDRAFRGQALEVLLPRGMSNHGGEQRIYPASRLEMAALLTRLDDASVYYIVIRG